LVQKKQSLTRKSSPKKQAAAAETSETIAEQTALFLKSGKKIEVIQSGISHKPTLEAKKQINLRS
jgi:SutA RNAP-binding domain